MYILIYLVNVFCSLKCLQGPRTLRGSPRRTAPKELRRWESQAHPKSAELVEHHSAVKDLLSESTPLISLENKRPASRSTKPAKPHMGGTKRLTRVVGRPPPVAGPASFGKSMSIPIDAVSGVTLLLSAPNPRPYESVHALLHSESLVFLVHTELIDLEKLTQHQEGVVCIHRDCKKYPTSW